MNMSIFSDVLKAIQLSTGNRGHSLCCHLLLYLCTYKYLAVHSIITLSVNIMAAKQVKTCESLA